MAPSIETVNTLRCAIKEWLIEQSHAGAITDTVVEHYLRVLMDEVSNFDD